MNTGPRVLVAGRQGGVTNRSRSPLRDARSDPGVSAALAEGLVSRPAADTAGMAWRLAEVFGEAAIAIVHYGSHARPSDAGPGSAHDFFVIVSGYRKAYQELSKRVGTHYPPWLGAVLNRILPPNVISVPMPGPSRTAKCAVLSVADLATACSSRARDHFVQGRLIQPVQLTWTRDPTGRAAVVAALVEARARTFDWCRPFLSPRFDVDEFCRTLLATSYAGEIRPEGTERVNELVEAQHDQLRRTYGPLLEYLSERGVLMVQDDLYADRRRPGSLRTGFARLYFAGSKVRSTLRWLKYAALYEGWLDYVLQKIERRSGVRIELTARERRWPLVFLWPRVIGFIVRRPRVR